MTTIQCNPIMSARKIKHPLHSTVESLVNKYEYKGNIANSAFRNIRNQLNVRMLLMGSFGFAPDCKSCPHIWTKLGGKRLEFEELRDEEGVRIESLLKTDGSFKPSDVCLDSTHIRVVIERIKRKGLGVVAKRDTERGVGIIEYVLKNTPKKKNPTAGGQ